MKMIAELCILLIFFIAYKFQGMYVAIGTAIALYTVQLAVQYIRHKPITRLEIITYASVILLGGSSIFFQNELFFKWKPSVIYVLFAAAILLTRFWTKAPAMQKVLGHTLELPLKIWSQLDFAWCGFLMTLSILNIIIAYQLSTDMWVYFKIFGTMTLLILFMVIQALWLSPHLKEGSPK
ncbi:MAG: inner membrane-spanning protein YciB [Gammaproteobacteria bacterium]